MIFIDLTHRTLNLTLSGVIAEAFKAKQIIPGATIDIVGSDGSTSQSITRLIQVDIFLTKISLKRNISYDLAVTCEGVCCQLILLNRR